MTLENRIQRLEGEAKIWRRVAALLAAVLCIGAACTAENGGGGGRVADASASTASEAAIAPRAVRTRVLALENESGNVVGFFYAKGDGATLQLGTPDVPNQIVLDSHQTPSLSISDHHSARADLTPNSLRVATFTDEGRRAIERQKQTEGKDNETKNAGLPEDRIAVRVGTGEGGGGMADFYNPFGNRVASMQSNKANAGSVILWDLNGKESKGLAAP
jgi:hypothetical protein